MPPNTALTQHGESDEHRPKREPSTVELEHLINRLPKRPGDLKGQR